MSGPTISTLLTTASSASCLTRRAARRHTAGSGAAERQVRDFVGCPRRERAPTMGGRRTEDGEPAVRPVRGRRRSFERQNHDPSLHPHPHPGVRRARRRHGRRRSPCRHRPTASSATCANVIQIVARGSNETAGTRWNDQRLQLGRARPDVGHRLVGGIWHDQDRAHRGPEVPRGHRHVERRLRLEPADRALAPGLRAQPAGVALPELADRAHRLLPGGARHRRRHVEQQPRTACPPRPRAGSPPSSSPATRAAGTASRSTVGRAPAAGSSATGPPGS